MPHNAAYIHTYLCIYIYTCADLSDSFLFLQLSQVVLWGRLGMRLGHTSTATVQGAGWLGADAKNHCSNLCMIATGTYLALVFQ